MRVNRDLNLLGALDALIETASVTAAAERMHVSAPAMSRTLGRIRAAFGDPILVRAGRTLVPTPRAEALRAPVRQVLEQATALLRPAPGLDPAGLDRGFAIRANDGFVATFGARLIARVAAQAPRVRLRFVAEGEEDVERLRDAQIDLDVGALGASGPEVRVQALLDDRYVGIVRAGHPLAVAPVTPASYAAGLHLAISRRGRAHGPLDEALAARGLMRRVSTVVATLGEALALVRGSDLVAAVPERLTETTRTGLHVFALPVATDPVTLYQMWHPRLDADAAHRWLREQVRAATAARVACHAP